MELVDTARLQTLLQPLRELLGEHCLRLLARPGWVALDRSSGAARVDVTWSESLHREVLQHLAEPVRIEGGVVVTEVAGNIVLRRPPSAVRGIDSLISEGWVSP